VSSRGGEKSFAESLVEKCSGHGDAKILGPWKREKTTRKISRADLQWLHATTVGLHFSFLLTWCSPQNEKLGLLLRLEWKTY